MKIYFMSRHEPDSKMMEDIQNVLGEVEIVQFGGSYSDIRSTPGGLAFTHTKAHKEGSTKTQEVIPKDSVVVAVLPPAMQMTFSKVCNEHGIVYLIPRFDRIPSEQGEGVNFEYAKLLRCLKVEIATEPWGSKSK